MANLQRKFEKKKMFMLKDIFKVRTRNCPLLKAGARLCIELEFAVNIICLDFQFTEDIVK